MKMTIMKATTEVAAMLVFILAWLMFATSPAYATGNGHNDDEQGQTQTQEQGQAQGQAQTAESDATATSTSSSEGGSGGAGGSGGTASSTNEGITVEGDTSNVENNSSNVVLVPNNNTERCLRVFGIAFGRGGESGALGIPWRSKKCDYEQAADDAFSAGERELGWFWKCENPNLYKSFKGKDESNESARADCLSKMLGGVTAIKTISTLTERLTQSEDLRAIERNRNSEAETRITEMCNESKNRMLDACVAK